MGGDLFITIFGDSYSKSDYFTWKNRRTANTNEQNKERAISLVRKVENLTRQNDIDIYNKYHIIQTCQGNSYFFIQKYIKNSAALLMLICRRSILFLFQENVLHLDQSSKIVSQQTE